MVKKKKSKTEGPTVPKTKDVFEFKDISKLKPGTVTTEQEPLFIDKLSTRIKKITSRLTKGPGIVVLSVIVLLLIVAFLFLFNRTLYSFERNISNEQPMDMNGLPQGGDLTTITQSNIPVIDQDNDGLPDIEENHIGTNMTKWDTDGDGVPDGWEVNYGKKLMVSYKPCLDPTDPSDRDGDPDDDGLTNLEEYSYGLFQMNQEREKSEKSLWSVPADGVWWGGTDPTKRDSDFDGMGDGYEIKYGLDPLNPLDAKDDSDHDGLANLQEYKLGTNPKNSDDDGDGLLDGENITLNEKDPLAIAWYSNIISRDNKDGTLTFVGEIDIGTNSTNSDTDGDGILDGWEVLWHLNPNDISDMYQDPDQDNLDNYNESRTARIYGNNTVFGGTDPYNSDSDGDGMPDGWEVKYSKKTSVDNTTWKWSLNPIDNTDANEDIDGDGLSNIEEFRGIIINVSGSEKKCDCDPNLPDTDFDGLSDYDEVKKYLTNPRSKDTDSDTLDDYSEAVEHTVEKVGLYNYTNPLKADTDSDGLNDFEEISIYVTYPNKADTDSDGLWDGEEIKGWYIKYINATVNTDPKSMDTDSDGLNDYDEVKTDFDENISETDRTNPRDWDTDSDGMSDGWEFNNSDPFGCGIPRWWLIKYRLDTSDPDIGKKDNDEDGFNNTIEYLYNTDPVDKTHKNTEFKEFERDGKKYTISPIPTETKGEYKLKAMLDKLGKNASYKIPQRKLVQPGLRINPLNGSDWNIDSDDDNLTNLEEYQLLSIYEQSTGPLNPDTDFDGMPDGWEINSAVQRSTDMKPNIDPTNPNDAFEDPDNDTSTVYTPLGSMSMTYTNLQEYQNSTNPNRNDTDGDGIIDSWEAAFNDPDSDGISSWWEIWKGLNPCDPTDVDEARMNEYYISITPSS